MSKTIAFIGAGNMGGAIIRATCRVVDPREVAIYDVLPEKADALAAETGCVAAGSGAEALDGAAYVMLCVKPQYYADTLRGLLPALKKNADAGVKQTLASIVTGAKMQTIAGLLAEGGAKDLRVYDASITPVSQLIGEAFRCKQIVLACPTYNGGVYPAIEAFVNDPNACNFINRCYLQKKHRRSRLS